MTSICSSNCCCTRELKHKNYKKVCHIQKEGAREREGGSCPRQREILNRRGKYLTFVLGPEVVYGLHGHRLQCWVRAGWGKEPPFHPPPSPASCLQVVTDLAGARGRQSWGGAAFSKGIPGSSWPVTCEGAREPVPGGRGRKRRI